MKRLNEGFYSLFVKLMLALFFVGFFSFLTAGSQFADNAVAGSKPDVVSLKPHKITISSRPVSFKRGNYKQTVFGSLIYRNGFQISSPSSYWGGLSGIAISKSGKKAALVSDAGFWSMVELDYKDGKLLPPDTSFIGPLLTKKGKPLKRGKDRDAEAITLLKDDKFYGDALISFEDNHRIGRFRISKEGISQPHKYLKLPAITRRLRGNAGLEAMAYLRGGKHKGTLVAIAQSKQDRHKNYIGWLVRGKKITKIRFTPPPLDTYRITDAVGLSNGDLLLLERRYKFLTVNIQVRYVRQSELFTGKPIKGRVVLEANSHEHLVDNMEGIAAHTNAKGETIVTLISDDNFNSFQRTLLMQFALPKNWQVAWKK